jgi:glutamyl-tRNA synthetase
MLSALKLRHVVIQDFSRLNFEYTLLSKRKLNWSAIFKHTIGKPLVNNRSAIRCRFVDNKVADGWFDPRFPTVQGMMRRGLVVPALREFILAQGASKRILDMVS